MRTRVPFNYGAKALIGRERTPKQVLFHASIEVDVPDISLGDASVAAALKVTPRSGPTATPCRVELRHDGEGFFEPTIRWRKDGPLIVDADGYAEIHTSAKAARNVLWPHLQQLAGFTALESTENIRILIDDRDVSAEHARITALRSRFIGGMLHHPAAEPVYVRTDNGAVSSARLTDVRGKMPAEQIFRADNQDPLLEYACSLKESQQSAILDRHSIEVFAPDTLTWKPERELVLAGGAALVERLARYLIEAPSDLVQEWLTLRDERTQWDIDRLGSRLFELCARIGDAGLPAVVTADTLRLLDLAGIERPELDWKPS